MRDCHRLCFGVGQMAVVFAAIFAVPVCAQDDSVPVERFLLEGRLADGAREMQDLIDADPEDQQARFSLGIVQFLQAIEGLGQDQYRYGLLAGRARSIPMMRLPISENTEPEEISYDKARALVQAFIDRLALAEESLSAVEVETVRLPVKLGAIRLDLNDDGEVPDEETMWHITQSLQNPRRPAKATPPKEFPIVFDAGDVVWLRGYCHALIAVGELFWLMTGRISLNGRLISFIRRLTPRMSFLLSKALACL